MHTFAASDGTRIHHNGGIEGKLLFNDPGNQKTGETGDEFGSQLKTMVEAALSGQRLDLARLARPPLLSELALREFAAHAIGVIAAERLDALSNEQLLGGEVRIPLPKIPV